MDFGGTKIEAAALDGDGRFVSRVRLPNPRVYEASLDVVRQVVEAVEGEVGGRFDCIGVGIPGSISPRTGLIRNANSYWLNDRPLQADMERVLDRPVRLRNDADCLIVSEAADGAAAGARAAFGVIIGTGCGGGLWLQGAGWPGGNGFAGEWGHTPLPWPTPEEAGAHRCWCGRIGCLETWISGTAFLEDFQQSAGHTLDGARIVEQARLGEPIARGVLERYIDRLARSLAVVCDILDPEVIVLGGGMSNIGELYDRLPMLIAGHVFSDTLWLWPAE
ncbi:MAG: fructokinase [Caulobacter sp.]|nr:fructokinase [Caulobacter sp.]